MAFVPRLTDNGILGSPWWYSSGNIFYASGWGMPNCTCYAYGRYAEIRGAFAALPGYDAGDWYDAATSFSRGSVPRLGAVACYKSRSGNWAGHVSIVEQIHPDGSITTSNSAYDGTFWELETVTPADGYRAEWMWTSRDYYLQGFIYNDAVGPPVSVYVIAAMCGCFKRESTMNPGIWESLTPTSWDHEYQYDGIGGYGLGQWTNVNTPYGRCWKLHQWVNANGYTDGDGNGQLAYVIHEAYWANHESTRGDYTTLAEFMETDSTNLDDLVWDFLANWEGVPGNAYDERLAAARLFLNYIRQHASDDPSDYHWISINNYLSESQMCNNAMCAYFFFSSIAPGPGPEPQPERRRKMPIWMYLRIF